MRADERLLDLDLRARAQALDVSRSFIVQAPAGSGKTELLIQRYLRLLSVVENPEEILAITFTRKAAAEMRDRVLLAMRDARTGKEATEAHHQTTLEAARSALQRDERLGWRLLESPHRLRIQTIDALSAAIARSMPVSSGLGATAELLSEQAIHAIYRSAAAATLDWLVAGGDNGKAVRSLLAHLDNHSGAYVEHIARMLETRDQWLGITGTGGRGAFDEPAVRGRLERNFANHVAAQLRKVAAMLPDGVVPELLKLGRYAAGNVADPSHPLRALQECSELPSTGEADTARWYALAELLLTRSGRWRRTINRTTGFPPAGKAEKREMLDILEKLSGNELLATELHRARRMPSARYSDTQWTVLLALIRLLPLAVAELRRIFAERRATDYTEVAIAANAALGGADEPGEIALLLDYSIQHLLIDEMQDTSIAQYDLIKKLVAGWQADDGRTLFCVGDPMQSVYRFRNAEVGEFLMARARGIADVKLDPLVLRRNFRSGETLVDWFNSVFSELFPAVDDVGSGAIAYTASVPVPAHAGIGSVVVHPLFGGSNDREAACGLDVVRECLASRRQQTVAVLVRSRTQLPSLLAGLRDAGIPFHAIDIDRLTDLPEILDLLALTRAVSHRDDRIAWLGLLRGPWVGLTWRDLHALVMNDTRHTVWELMHDESRIAALSSDAALRLSGLRRELSPFLEGHGLRTLQETVERAWYRLGGPALLRSQSEADSVYRFFDLLARTENAGTLSDVSEFERRLDDERASAGAPPDARLQIMTMHKAKGLQFDHVVLYGLGRRARSDRKSVLSWLNVPGPGDDSDFLISPLGARSGSQADPLHELIEARLREKGSLEQDRLLYVACTRARESLHLIGHVPLVADGNGFREPYPASLLSRVWPAVRDHYAEAFSRQGAAAGGREHKRRDLRHPTLYRLTPFLPRIDPPPLPGGTRDVSPATEAGRTVDFHWAGTATRHAGRLVHRILQQLSDRRIDVETLADHGTLAGTAKRWARELGVPEAAIDGVWTRTEEAVMRILEDKTGRWIVFGPGHAELELTGVWQGQIESVVIDRVREDEAGVHWIIDYKTGTHEGGDLDFFLAQEVERYRSQLTRYATVYRNLKKLPVRAALYFPLIQAFREVPLDMPSAR